MVTGVRAPARAQHPLAPLRRVAAHSGPALLAAVATAWVAAQFAVTFRVGLGWDETVYLTQYAHGIPPDVFSAPRARGVPLLVAPVTLLTTSVAAIRAYLTVASGVGLFCAYWPWVRLRPGAVVPLAAALFAACWVAMFYGNEAMPNTFVAYGAVAAVGLFVHAAAPAAAAQGRHRWALAGLFAAFAFTSLVRPTDALWVGLLLIAAALVVRAWRRPAPLAAVAAGLAVGWGEWIGEAYASYGGLVARLHAAGAQNETGLHFSLGQQLAGLSGQHILCRPACHGVSPLAVAWFFAVPLVGLLGVYAARRRPWSAATALAGAAGVVVAASYILGVGYAAPRFLLPYYALAALPVAEGLAWLARGPRPGARLPTASVAVLGVFAYLLIQAHGMLGVLHQQVPARAATVQAAHALVRLGVHPPCFVYGHDAPQIAYPDRCAAWGLTGEPDGTHTPAHLRHASASAQRVVVVAHQTGRPAPFLAQWERVHLTGPDLRHWYAYLPPNEKP